jgi:hypothetical protein
MVGIIGVAMVLAAVGRAPTIPMQPKHILWCRYQKACGAMPTARDLVHVHQSVTGLHQS